MGLAEFVLVATLVEITPGPNMAYLASLAAVHGRRAGIQAVLGILLGLAAYGILAAFGLAALVGASPTLYAALRFAGVAYMLWLAVEAWRDGDAAPDALQRPVDGGHAGRRGFLVSVLNPKAGVFYLTVLPEFVDPARGAPDTKSHARRDLCRHRNRRASDRDSGRRRGPRPGSARRGQAPHDAALFRDGAHGRSGVAVVRHAEIVTRRS